MHRRRFLYASALASATGPLAAMSGAARHAQPATPAPEVASDPAARVAAVTPTALHEALLATPVTTPLLPLDTPPVEPVAWEDTSDTDLAGTVGGIVFNTGYDDNDNFLAIGNVIVHPDASSASAAVGAAGPTAAQHFLDLPWFVAAHDDYALSVVQIDYLLLVGGAERPREEVQVVGDDAGTPSAGATPAAGAGSRSLELRAVSNMTALLDHLDGVLAGLGV